MAIPLEFRSLSSFFRLLNVKMGIEIFSQKYAMNKSFDFHRQEEWRIERNEEHQTLKVTLSPLDAVLAYQLISLSYSLSYPILSNWNIERLYPSTAIRFKLHWICLIKYSQNSSLIPSKRSLHNPSVSISKFHSTLSGFFYSFTTNCHILLLLIPTKNPIFVN